MTNTKPDDRFALLDKLASLVTDADLTEVSYVDGELEIVMSRAATVAPVMAAAPMAAMPAAAQAAAPAATAPTAAPEVSGQIVKAPMVGTSYMAASPDAAPFVKVGDTVTEGQTLMIIEAMKVMNPLPSPFSGVVQDIKVSNGETVEFDQSLIIIA